MVVLIVTAVIRIIVQGSRRRAVVRGSVLSRTVRITSGFASNWNLDPIMNHGSYGMTSPAQGTTK